MNKGFFFVVLLLVLPLVSCQRSTDLTDAQRTTVIQGVQQMALQFFDDLRTHNAPAVVGHLDSSDAFFWVFPPDTAVVSRASLAAALRAELEANPSIESRWLRIRVEPLTATVAAYSGVFEQMATDTEGKTVRTLGIESAVVVLRDDGWKFLNGQTTLSVEPGE